MNSKVLAIIVGLIVIIGGGAAWYAMSQQDNDTNETTNTTSKDDSRSFTPHLKKACDILTKDKATALIGNLGSDPADKPAGGAASSDIDVSTCTYMQDTANMTGGQILNEAKQVSILARVAKSETGALSNKNQFGEGKPQGVEDVSGYGDKAYWDPNMKQLNIFKNNNWYILTNGTNNPTNNTLDDAKKLADAIKDEL